MTLKFLATAILLDHHVGNFVDAFIGSKAAIALQAFAATANQISCARFAGVHHLVIEVCAKRALHRGLSSVCSILCAHSADSTASAASSSAVAMRRSSPMDQPSLKSKGKPARQQPAKVMSQRMIETVAAGSFSTPKISVKTRNVASCAPPPTPGSCAVEPTTENASTSIASE